MPDWRHLFRCENEISDEISVEVDFWKERIFLKRVFERKSAILLMAAAVLVLALFTACNNDRIPSSTTSGLVGSWDWTVAGLTTEGYYVFNANGTGNYGFDGERTEFRWGTRGGTIYMCHTLSICGNSCPAPLEMPYSLSGDNLDITLLGTTYSYTRGN